MGFIIERGPMRGDGNWVSILTNIAHGRLVPVWVGEDADFRDAVRVLYILKTMGADIVPEGQDIVTVSLPAIGDAAEVALELTEFPYGDIEPTAEDEAEAEGVLR